MISWVVHGKNGYKLNINKEIMLPGPPCLLICYSEK